MIGILAGMGARSTAPFVDLVITQCQRQYGARFDEEYPHMMIYSLPVPFRLDRPFDNEAMKEMIKEGLRKLESIGVEFIAMPCNTAHMYYDELVASIGVPLLNMIDETLKAMPPSARRITLLATPMTVGAGLYQRGIARAGLELVVRESWQKRVDELIGAIKHSTDSSLPQTLWEILAEEIAADGVDTVLLGCTDLNVIVPRLPDGVVLLDATECLAAATVKRYLAGRARQSV